MLLEPYGPARRYVLDLSIIVSGYVRHAEAFGGTAPEHCRPRRHSITNGMRQLLHLRATPATVSQFTMILSRYAAPLNACVSLAYKK